MHPSPPLLQAMFPSAATYCAVLATQIKIPDNREKVERIKKKPEEAGWLLLLAESRLGRR